MLKEYFVRLIYGPGVTPLPFGKSILFFFIFLLNAMMTTMVFPYLPRLVKYFGTEETKVGSHVGYIASSMFLSQALFSYLWGYIGDKIGRNVALLISCIGASVAALLFAFTKSFWWALSTRFLQGMWSVYIASVNAFFAVCDETNKPIAMTLCLSAYATGLVMGPSIGGYMVFLSERYPKLVPKESFLGHHHIFIPNVILSIGFLICAIFSYFFVFDLRRCTKHADVFIDTNVKVNCNDVQEKSEKKVIEKSSGTYERRSNLLVLVSSKQCVLSCAVSFFFNISSIGFNELYPVWADASRKNNGLELTVSQIGTSLIVAAFFVMFLQPIIVSRASTKFGVKRVLMFALILQLLLYPLYPPIAFIDNRYMEWVLLCINIVITRLAVGASYVGITVIVNNSVDQKYSGSANGFSNGVSAIGRLVAPLIFGSSFSWSLSNIRKNHPSAIGFPFDQNFSFILMSIIMLITCILLCPIIDRRRTSRTKSYEKL